ncbi:MAG TPA: hypothetical protein VI895_03940 [Bdellovibrionota bacterium]|nr:hypothetical protein [Bdellovibrionota bacterium]
MFHVQTEDNGLSNPVVVTHLYVGGNILATRKRSYEKFAAVPSLQEIVLSMMKDQHKEMMKDLVHGRIRSALRFLAAQPAVRAPIAVRPSTPTSPPAGEPPGVKPAPAAKPFPPPSSATAPVRPSGPIPPLGQRPAVPPPATAPRPYRRPASVTPAAAVPTLDTSGVAEKTLDELILEFLGQEQTKP